VSDIALTSYAYKIASERLKELIAEYNDPELTTKGKREVLEQKLFFVFLEGVRFQKDMQELENRGECG
jgi:hypothetical protein